MYVYQVTDKWKLSDGSVMCLYTVGYFDPNGKWVPESDYSTSEEAANRVHFLNGGKT